MKDHYMLNREIIIIHHTEFNVSTASADMVAWHAAYTKGYRSPSHLMPVLRNSPSNPDWWGFHRFIIWERLRRGMDA